jgi:hypothetical protein
LSKAGMILLEFDTHITLHHSEHSLCVRLFTWTISCLVRSR